MLFKILVFQNIYLITFILCEQNRLISKTLKKPKHLNSLHNLDLYALLSFFLLRFCGFNVNWCIVILSMKSDLSPYGFDLKCFKLCFKDLEHFVVCLRPHELQLVYKTNLRCFYILTNLVLLFFRRWYFPGQRRHACCGVQSGGDRPQPILYCGPRHSDPLWGGTHQERGQ